MKAWILGVVLVVGSGGDAWGEPSAPAKKASKPDKAGADPGAHLVGGDAPKDQPVYAYLVEGLPFIQRAVHGKVWAKFWPAYILSAVTVPVGGLLWVPFIFYKDVPDHPAKTKARILGAIGTAISLGGAFFFIFPALFSPLILIPVYGWLFLAVLVMFAAVMTAWWALVSSIPVGGWFGKIVLLAHSDAYALGKDGAGKKSR
jgi:hypothetical protein